MNRIPTVEEAEAADREEYRLADIAHMANQLFIQLVAQHAYEPTAQVLRQFKRRAHKAANIFYELPKAK